MKRRIEIRRNDFANDQLITSYEFRHYVGSYGTDIKILGFVSEWKHGIFASFGGNAFSWKFPTVEAAMAFIIGPDPFNY